MGLFFQHGCRIGFYQTTVFVYKQLLPILILQRVDLLGDSGLGNTQEIRGFPEIHYLAEQQKGVDAMVQHSGLLNKIILSYY